MPAPSNRFVALDILKTVLVYGMVAAHLIQLASLRLPQGAAWFSGYIDLITFSGFMFAFGVGVGLPKPESAKPVGARIWPALVMLGAVYVSSVGYVVLVARQPLAPVLTDLVTLRVLFGYSKFLASFFVLYLVIALARPVLVGIGETPRTLVAVSMLCLAGTLVTTGANIPLIGAVVGSTNYASFPLLAYLPWFLVGIHFGSTGRRPDWLDLLAGFAASAPLAYFLWRTGEMPQRFPPSLLWVIGPGFVLMIYWWVSRLLGRLWPQAAFFLLAPGRHVLAALVISNLAVFGIRRQMFKPISSVPSLIMATAAIMALVTVICLLMDRFDTRRAGRS